MAGYTPLNISGNQTGLVQERQNFLLPNDAYPTLENAYVWREQIRRKQGCQILGRLQRNFTTVSLGTSPASLTWTFVIYTTVTPNISTITENPSIVPSSVVITDGVDTFTDQGNGILKRQDGDVSSTINYLTSSVTLHRNVALANAFTITFGYYPGLPVMGLRLRDQNLDIIWQTVAFDTKYAYIFNGTTWTEFLPGTTWTGLNYEFFWSTNYWTDALQNKIFWASNYSSVSHDPIRYTNGLAFSTWVDFTPIINSGASNDKLLQALCILPFRGRLVVFNTYEQSGGVAGYYTNRIRWAAIGTPFTTSAAITVNTNTNAWKDDIRGQGGFLDIPTSEDIVSVGFVRDNLVIYCERSTWQLRYTGRTIAPFQIERVNSELGAESTFSTVQFDTSLVGIGDKGIVECDSYKSERIDIKIPDLLLTFQTDNQGTYRVHGIRNFFSRLAYWIYPDATTGSVYSTTFPNKRLVYNYENDSWAIFDDSFTCLGTIQAPNARTWLNTNLAWIQCNFPWTENIKYDPDIIAGNQQGFVVYLDSQTTNDPTLYISAVTGNTTTPTTITSSNHNLRTDQIIKILGIPNGTPFANLNGVVFQVDVTSADQFDLYTYNSTDYQFSNDQLDAPNSGFVGVGNIAVLDNFNITSKKFNFMEEGQNIKLGYLDILMNATEQPFPGAITLNVYVDYNDVEPMNTYDQNLVDTGSSPFLPDGFFNQTIPTTASDLNNQGGTKFMQRVYCPMRGNFITLQYTLSNSQMIGIEQMSDVQIDSQTLWVRRGGRNTQI